MSNLEHRLLAVHTALDAAKIPHAFGGAIALAYCIREPRGTVDIDVNVFAEPDQAAVVFEALPAAVTVRKSDPATVRRDGQVRLRWADTPIDLFFANHEFHRSVEQGVTQVPFADTTIPVLSCDALATFKVLFNRGQDWADIEAMVDAGMIDGPAVLESLSDLLQGFDPGLTRFRALVEARF